MSKERTSFGVVFFIRTTRLNKHGEAPINLRITVDSDRAETTVKKTIHPKFWDATQGRALAKNAVAKEINVYIESIKAKIIRIHRDLEIDGVEYITAQMVLDKFLGRDRQKRQTIVELFKEHNQICRKIIGNGMTKATITRYDTCLRHVQAFIKEKFSKDDLFLDEINHQFVKDFELYFKGDRSCNHNTTMKYLKNFKKIILIALDREMIRINPFSRFKFSYTPVKRDFLEEHEIKKMYNKEFSMQRLTVIKDIFIFCCYTGLAFVDIRSLTHQHLAKDKDNSTWIIMQRQKSSREFNVPLVDIPLAIIEKYKDHPACQIKGTLLPVQSLQKMNAYLKEVADLCGIEKTLSSHIARHNKAHYYLLINRLRSIRLSTGNDLETSLCF